MRSSARRARTRLPLLALPLVSLLALACASVEPAPPPEPTPAPPEVEVLSAPQPETPGLPDIYARHIAEIVEEDIALGRIVVRLGETIGGQQAGARMMLEEEAFSRIIDDVKEMRSSHVDIVTFWDRVKDQWAQIATHEDRAALDLLGEIPAKRE